MAVEPGNMSSPGVMVWSSYLLLFMMDDRKHSKHFCLTWKQHLRSPRGHVATPDDVQEKRTCYNQHHGFWAIWCHISFFNQQTESGWGLRKLRGQSPPYLAGCTVGQTGWLLFSSISLSFVSTGLHFLYVGTGTMAAGFCGFCGTRNELSSNIQPLYPSAINFTDMIFIRFNQNFLFEPKHPSVFSIYLAIIAWTWWIAQIIPPQCDLLGPNSRCSRGGGEDWINNSLLLLCPCVLLP